MRFSNLLLIGLLGACRSTPPTGDAIALKGYEFAKSGDFVQASQTLENAISTGLVGEDPKQAYTVLGNAYSQQGLWKKSIESHKKALAIDPNYATAWINLGIIYRLGNNFDDAEKSYLKAIELEPKKADLHATLGAIYIRKGTPSKAVTHLTTATQIDPTGPISWGNLALAYAATGELTKAQTSLNTAKTLGYKNTQTIQARIDKLKAPENPVKPKN